MDTSKRTFRKILVSKQIRISYEQTGILLQVEFSTDHVSFHLCLQVEILGTGGNLAKGKKDQWALIGHRDDAPDDPYYQKG